MENYPTHEEISAEIAKLVLVNMNNAFQHNRESLDDLIIDLTLYRETLPLAIQYMKKGLL
jgi:hypothetical protein